MARTPSVMVDLGTPAPEFHLPDVVTGNTISLDTFTGKTGLLVMFICRHCPYVKHIQDQLAQLGRDYQNQDLGIVAISSNDAEKYPDDAPESLKEMAETLGFTFPFCYDATQSVAKAYQAACTPDFYLFDRQQKLVYRGQLDDSRPKSDPPIPVTGKDLRAALDALLSGQAIPTEQRASIGCNIKWQPGNEPDYYKTA
ncbi:Thiol-disulfide isomerase and thioredoxins [Gloeomargarita lithophora Alchichica-D10]|uniref:Thiol-disulfide isomerase and thioredoxins n=1 Tax=Gloeomargarita lithophora Alchichica-D10 TaxID=1188229 RepID=A0A1J0ABH4_9CYAN|nr:thioredoxin family protein [Gloeomargarita lithophora]APB33284.1 Thiol-disulfide isomerase and thioredoxins [Gloeomargarita lithophora Alchichica-D10]